MLMHGGCDDQATHYECVANCLAKMYELIVLYDVFHPYVFLSNYCRQMHFSACKVTSLFPIQIKFSQKPVSSDVFTL